MTTTTSTLSIEPGKRNLRRALGWCGEVKTLCILPFEHIIPRFAGGKTVFENLCLACPACNGFKGNRTAAPDPTTQKKALLFHPQHDLCTEHFAWSEDATQITGLTPTGRATIAALQMNRPQLIRVRRMWVAMGKHPPDRD